MGARMLVVLCTAAVVTSGCADSSAERGGPKEAARAVKTDAVRQESVRRSPRGRWARWLPRTRSPVSSEVEGVVRRVLADLGDRVTAGQALVELDREKLQYNLDQQRAAHARALTRYGAPDSTACRGRRDARRAAGCRRTRAGQAGASSARPRCTNVNSSRSRRSMTPTPTLRPQACGLRHRAAERRRTSATDIDASAAAMKLAERQSARHLHPRAVRRLRPAADGIARRTGESADAGDDRRPRGSAEAAAPRFPSAWRRGSKSDSR